MLVRKLCWVSFFFAIGGLIGCTNGESISKAVTAVPSAINTKATTTPTLVAGEATAVSTTPPPLPSATPVPTITATKVAPTPTMTPTVSPWPELAKMPVALSEMPAVVLNGRIFIAGGFGNGPTLESAFMVYDPQSDSWARLADLPFSLNHHAMAVVNEQIYVFATEANLPTLRYDAVQDIWVELEPMPESRWAATAVVLDDAVYIVGGQGRSQSLLRYDPANDAWAELAPLRRPREHLAAVALDGQIYAIGGRWDRVTNTVERYDPETNQWTAVNGMNQPRSGFGAAVQDGKIVVGGGELFEPLQTLDSIEIYNPAEREWILQTSSLPSPLHGFPFIVLEDELYVIGGSGRAGDVSNRGRLYVLRMHD